MKKECRWISPEWRGRLSKAAGKAWRALASLPGRVVLSLLVAVALLLGDYFIDNCPYPLFDDVDTLGLAEHLTGRMAHEVDDSVLYINVGFDKQLVPVVDDFGDTVGKTVITDRTVLLKLLEAASRADYRFLALDVRFDKGMTTDCDSALWRLMGRLPRFAYSSHADGEDAAAENAGGAAALADYGATLSTGFTRWQFLQDGKESMPLTIYRSTDNGTLSQWGPFYFDNGHLCRNTLFVPLPSDLLEPYRESGELRYPLAGGHLMRWNSDDELSRMMNGRIVVIGDFENDVHDTYIGSVPGPAIIYSAYLELHRGRHFVNPWFMIAMLLIYATMCFSVLSGDGLLDRVAWVRRHPALRTLLSFVGWEIVLSAMGLLMYILFAESFISILPAATFTALGWIRQHVKFTPETA